MMQLLDEIAEEHRLIDRVAGSLIRFAEWATDGSVNASDVADFARFFTTFVTGYHHEREEHVLFPALVNYAEVPGDRGPLAVIEAEHRAAAGLVDELAARADDGGRPAEVARRLAHHLWEHVDKEDSVLLPEAEKRLVRGGVTRLEGRPPTTVESEARDLGKRLIERLPPLDDPEAVRGDGCVACSAFTETCRGIEKEWWNTWETEYHRSLDEG
jgi:hemerythrin-like domain-containing protein